ncbi:S-adenosyl-L-methionine-dependent methyltransferase, partial [Mollisia scopiformis]
TSTTSIRSSIYENIEENGRTYHHFKQGKYNLPNDEVDHLSAPNTLLDLQHTLFYLTLHEKLYLAPIGVEPHNVRQVLDIATGTGIWAIEFSHLFPSAQIVGTDLSAIQPLYVPPNCRFEIDDAEDEWNFAEKFDYVHGRALLSCFKDPKHVISEAFKSLAPGGYLELQDAVFPFNYIGEPPVDSDLYRWNKLCVEGSTKIGRPWTNVLNYKRWLTEVGFEDVVEKSFYWPTNKWVKGKHNKQIAAFFQADMLNGIEGMSLKVIGQLGWTADEIRSFLVGVKNDLKDTSIPAYLSIKVVYGKKPQLTEA